MKGYQTRRSAFEPSRETKARSLSTKKQAFSRGGFTHPGLTSTYGKSLYITLFVLAITLECLALILLNAVLPFHPSIIAGLVALEIGGAALWHYGTADKTLRKAKLAVAESQEDQDYLLSTRPMHFKIFNALGFGVIVLPAFFKMASIIYAAPILGGWTAALLCIYAGCAAIHLSASGYAMASIRESFAEYLNFKAMMSPSEKHDREAHRFHINDFRTTRFETNLRLAEVSLPAVNHRLESAGQSEDGQNLYVIKSWGRLTDAQLDCLSAHQESPEAQSVVLRQGLRAQLEIESSDPIESSVEAHVKSPAPDSVHPRSNKGNHSSSNVGAVASVAAKITMLILACSILVTASCARKDQLQPVQIHLMTANAFEEDVLRSLLPNAPIARRFVPDIVLSRLDSDDVSKRTLPTLLPKADEGVGSFFEAAWQFENPVLSYANLLRRVSNGGFDADLFDRRDDICLDHALAKVDELTKEDERLLFLQPSDGANPIEKAIVCRSAKEVLQFIEAELEDAKNPVELSFSVILDLPAPAPKPLETAQEQEEPNLPPKPVMVERLRSLGKIYFDLGSDALDQKALVALKAIKNELEQVVGQQPRIILAGGADGQGDKEFNQVLSENRVISVEAWLMSQEILVEKTLAYGEQLASQGPPKELRTVSVYVVEMVPETTETTLSVAHSPSNHMPHKTIALPTK